MGIKLAYIFFKTYETLKGIEFLAIDGFYFNDNSPIKAIGNKFFIKENDEVIMRSLKDGEAIKPFVLPKIFKKGDFSKEVLPNYVLDVV